jgi:anti-sigma regulatory factor (Ser/Thr protein kinase)
MARREIPPDELLDRLTQLVATLGASDLHADLHVLALGELAATTGAVAATLVLRSEPDEPALPVAAWGPSAAVGDGGWLALDLRVGSRRIGTLRLGFAQAPDLTNAERSSLHAAASLVAHAIENVRLVAAGLRGEETRSRLAFLAEVSNAVASSLAMGELLDRLCAVGVPRLGDWSTILLPEGLVLERCAGVHADPGKQHLVDRLVGSYPVSLAGGSPIAQAYRTGEAVVVPAIDRAVVTSIVDDRDYVDTVLQLSAGGGMMVPLIVRGRSVGVLAFGLEGAGRQFSEDDVWLATEMARRAAIGIDNARQYEQEHLVAELLQRAVLPEQLPTATALDMAARYLPAGPGVEVGGDWYDAFIHDDGSVGLVIGDVAGHDIQAASAMAQLRNALRAYALEGASPAVVLNQLNRLLCRSADPLFASVIFAVISADRRRLTWANAGHPPAVVVRGEGARVLSRPRGLVLGVRADLAYPEGTTDLDPDDLLVLYTDGLVERRSESIEVGIDRLETLAVKAAGRGPSADAVAERLLQSLLAGQARADDVCLLTAWLIADAVPPLELGLPADPTSSRVARQRVAAVLQEWGAGVLADPVELLVSELVTNAVSHVGTDVRLRVEKLPAGVRVRVFDGGVDPLQPRPREVPPDSPTGRGLLIVDNVADRWGVERTDAGKQVWFELSYVGAERRWHGAGERRAQLN